MYFSVRQLTSVDLTLLRELNVLFGEAFHDLETYCAEPPGDTYLAGLLAREHVVALVALSGEEVIGGLVVNSTAEHSPRSTQYPN